MMHTVLHFGQFLFFLCIFPFGESRPGLGLADIKAKIQEKLPVTFPKTIRPLTLPPIPIRPMTMPPGISLPPLSNLIPDSMTKIMPKDIDVIKNLCNKVPCNVQSDLAKKTKDNIIQVLSSGRGNGRVPGKSSEEIDRYLNTMLDAKKALLSGSELKDVVTPHDNGLWAGDQLPTLEFLQHVIVNVNSSIPANLTLSRRKRASGISLDYYSGNKWPSQTVNFYLDPSTFSQDEADLIRAAIKTIQDGTCLKFVESLQAPYVEFLKTPYGTDSGTCGWANLGYSGDVNEAYLNFDSSLCKPTFQGVIVHEALHVLGISHEHNRYDRDNYVQMDWNNVDPQSYDVYDHDNAYDYNPYCVGYDYLSVMHYSPYVAVIDSSKPAFRPLSNPDYYLPKIGQATAPSATDLSLLNRLYCSASSCVDVSPYCGWTACSDCATYGASCPKSCGQCQI